jgi:hypothetical protein
LIKVLHKLIDSFNFLKASFVTLVIEVLEASSFIYLICCRWSLQWFLLLIRRDLIILILRLSLLKEDVRSWIKLIIAFIVIKLALCLIRLFSINEDLRIWVRSINCIIFFKSYSRFSRVITLGCSLRSTTYTLIYIII